MVPTTKDEWWQLLEDRWEQISDILHMFLPMWEHHDIWYTPTVPSMDGVVENLRIFRNPEIARYLNAAWASAPDDSSIHSIPGWGALCNLCSEEWCLYEEENDQR